MELLPRRAATITYPNMLSSAALLWALTVLVAAAGGAVLSLRLAGAAVGGCGRRGRSSAGGRAFTFIEEAVHVVSKRREKASSARAKSSLCWVCERQGRKEGTLP